MTTYVFTNFAMSALEVEISAADTEIIIGAEDEDRFPTLTGDQAFFFSLYDGVNDPEIAVCTARTGQTLTVTRGQDGTSARAWQAGTKVNVAMTAGLFEALRTSSFTSDLSGAADGKFMKHNGTMWVAANIQQSDVSGLVSALSALTSGLASHTHTAAQVAGGNPTFTTILANTPVALATNYNLNDLSDTGVYTVVTPTNGPAAGTWHVFHAKLDGNTAYQEANELTNADLKTYTRRKVAGTWAAWEARPTNATVTAAVAAGGIPTCIAGGTADVITADFSPNVTFADQVMIRVRCPSANTTTTPTLSQDSDSARTIVTQAGGALWAGALQGDHLFQAELAGNKWRVLNPHPNIPTIVGKKGIWVPAASFRAKATNGCTFATYDSGSNDVMIYAAEFDATTQQYGQFAIAMPTFWNEGTVTFKPYWTNTAGLTTENVVFSLAGAAFSNDDGLNATAFGTVQTSNDTWLAQNDLHIGPESSAITIAGSPSAGDLVVFEVSRVVASDNMTGKALLLGLMLYITTDAVNEV